jgi:probable HAF family extracellular repeat protein
MPAALSFRLRPLAAALALACAGSAANAAIVFDVQDLGTLGGSQSWSYGLNDAGHVVGQSLLASGSLQAFVHDGQSMKAVGGAASNVAVGINNAGVVVGNTVNDAGQQRGFVSRAGVVTTLGTLGGKISWANAVNGAGHVVGNAARADGATHAFLYADGRMHDLMLPGRGSANAINDSGEIAGHYWLGDNMPGHAFTLRGGVFTDLNPLLGATYSSAHLINGRGHVVGLADGQGFYYDGTTAHRLTALGLREMAPVAVNDAGLVVGQAIGTDYREYAFVSSAVGPLVDLNTLIAPVAGRHLYQATGINVHGQIAATTDQQRALLLTPRGTLAWAAVAGGRLADGRHWDSGIGFAPTKLLDVVLAPAASQTVVVDEAASARSFALGGGAGQVTLQFERGARLVVGQGMAVHAGATLSGDGFIEGAVINHGTVRAAPGQQLTFVGGLQNQGTVTGSGRLGVALVNLAGGSVRVGSGELLVLAGSSHLNAGTVEVRQGGELQTVGRLQNQAGGTLRLDAATVRFADGVDNAGALQIGYGGASVFGAVSNRTGAKIIVSGGAATTFWDAVHNDGEVRASAGARVVYFGAVNGGGSFTTNGSGGYHRFEAGYAPGNSPALATLGNTEFTGTLQMELGGLQPGAAHDQIVFTGSVLFDAGSALDVALIDGFVPHAGDAFRLFVYAQAPQGRFEAFMLPSLDGGLAWDTSDLYSGGWLRVSPVPEPGSWLLWTAGLAALRLRAARRRAPAPAA